MQHVSEVLAEEHFVDCSKSLVIECRCGEKLLLLGRESDWISEGRTVFECGGCGKELSLEDGR
jgi:DNA-directed RNA polymerase subunit RPC12/RpoP